MMVSERERTAYGAEYDYASLRNDRYARYDYDRSYEEERNRTSQSYRDSLMDSLERPANRSRLERADENRYGFYMQNINAGENNYDKFWDAKQNKQSNQPEQKDNHNKRLAFLVTYIVIAVVALVAVTLSVVGLGDKTTTIVSKKVETETVTVMANAETDDVILAGIVAAEQEEEEASVVGGQNYIMLKSGEVVAVEAPQRAQEAKEEEGGFDKFCNWLNNVFGG